MKNQKAPILIAAFLILLTALSLAAILFPRQNPGGYVADIYQDGTLIASIPLEQVQEPYVLTVTGENGCINEIEVRPGSIGMLSADCPDRLCVRQGFISHYGLPVTCLPNRVVISLRPADDKAPESVTADIFTY